MAGCLLDKVAAILGIRTGSLLRPLPPRPVRMNPKGNFLSRHGILIENGPSGSLLSLSSWSGTKLCSQLFLSP